MTHDLLKRIYARYGVTSRRELIRAIRAEWAAETEEPCSVAEAERILEHMIEAERGR